MPKKPSPPGLTEYQKKRDFGRTSEPSGAAATAPSADGLRFVIQKHAATNLHFDLRLEMDGVMRSWAVPKGPSLDPKAKRLAMEVEDHPIAYNDFEGTIPKGEYGGGTVMLWDRGTYTPDEPKPKETAEQAVLRGYREGKLAITFDGDRLQGSYALVRTDTVQGGIRSKWLFFKHKDRFADPKTDITEEEVTSVVTGRTMAEIARGEGGKRVWHSNRSKQSDGTAVEKGSSSKATAPKLDLSSLSPMLAQSTTAPPSAEGWIFEPKYDGIRILALATADTTVLVTRNGLDKARQFPEVVTALRKLVAETGRPVVIDGEVVALEGDRIRRFEGLQGRMHVQDSALVRQHSGAAPAALMAFDLLLVGTEVLLQKSWRERRDQLEGLLGGRTSVALRITEYSEDGPGLIERGKREDWEGVIAKRASSRYKPGLRSPDWLKLKLENQQEFVVGGWTDPRKSRAHLGALLLGYYDDKGDLIYAGHTGTGFSGAQLADMYRRLKPLEREASPFTNHPKTNEPAHWAAPALVVEVRFNEWTRDGKLRQPVYLGLREDKDPRDVVREKGRSGAATDESSAAKASVKAKLPSAAGDSKKSSLAPPPGPLVKRLEEIARSKSGEGSLKVGHEATLQLTSLRKIFYPETKHTKEALLAYYCRMGEYILPWMADRPLVLKRFPNGVEKEAFYQQSAPDAPPEGVRVDKLQFEGKLQPRMVGGNLTTLLYTVQLGAISYDPWHSRVNRLETPDYTILDLDPGPAATFQDVIEVAVYVKEELDALGFHAGLKTSGSRGLHIYLPLPDGTPLDAATLIAQIIATRVTQKHPQIATVERFTKNRPEGTIYVDYLQNILGKTVAGVYAVRAKSRPTVSTPLDWSELTPDLDLQAFTVDTVPDRVKEVGDLWGPMMAVPNNLESLTGKRRKG